VGMFTHDTLDQSFVSHDVEQVAVAS